MLLDTYEIPRRPITLSAHQYKKKFGSNLGYAQYKKEMAVKRRQWDVLHKEQQKLQKTKTKFLSKIHLSDEALQQALGEGQKSGLSIPEVLEKWLEAGRKVPKE